jgi:hypothetical protein
VLLDAVLDRLRAVAHFAELFLGSFARLTEHPRTRVSSSTEAVREYRGETPPKTRARRIATPRYGHGGALVNLMA